MSLPDTAHFRFRFKPLTIRHVPALFGCALGNGISYFQHGHADGQWWLVSFGLCYVLGCLFDYDYQKSQWLLRQHG